MVAGFDPVYGARLLRGRRSLLQAQRARPATIYQPRSRVIHECHGSGGSVQARRRDGGEPGLFYGRWSERLARRPNLVELPTYPPRLIAARDSEVARPDPRPRRSGPLPRPRLGRPAHGEDARRARRALARRSDHARARPTAEALSATQSPCSHAGSRSSPLRSNGAGWFERPDVPLLGRRSSAAARTSHGSTAS